MCDVNIICMMQTLYMHWKHVHVMLLGILNYDGNIVYVTGLETEAATGSGLKVDEGSLLTGSVLSHSPRFEGKSTEWGSLSSACNMI